MRNLLWTLYLHIGSLAGNRFSHVFCGFCASVSFGLACLRFCLFSCLGSVFACFFACLGFVALSLFLSVSVWLCSFLVLVVSYFICSISGSFPSGSIGSTTVCHLPKYILATSALLVLYCAILIADIFCMSFVSACIARHFHSLNINCRSVNFHQRCLAKNN